MTLSPTAPSRTGSRLRATSAVLAALTLLASLHAQAKKPAEPPPPPVDDAAAVVLNPFVVNTEKDTGYAGSSTLAGTRLNTPIADLGASISIYTKEFLDDIGATSVNDALIYATGMEAGGPGGNFSGLAGNNIANESVQSDASRNEPQSVVRTRGIGTPNLTRGFFATDIGTDSYITESITVNRGPNAILAGVGSAAGVVESGVLRANVTRNSNRVQFRYGNNDSTRTNVDFNRVLIPKHLAFRIAALDEDERYNQRPAFEKKQRVYGAVNFEPWKTTAFRANFEAGGSKANRPFTGLPFNSISTEWLATKKTYDWTYFDDPARNPQAAAMNPNSTNFPLYQQQGLISPYLGQGQIFGGLVQVYDNANAKGPSVGFQSTGPATTTTFAANAVRTNVFDPLFNRDIAADQYWFIETFNKAEIPAFTYRDGFKPAGIKFQGFTNYDAFDWEGRQIDETGRQSDSFNTSTFTLEQRAWRDRVGVELTYFRQRYELRNRNAFFSTGGNGNHIRIDPNVTLENGLPNPNVGRPYTAFGQTADGNSFRNREATRITAFLRYDFRELSPKWGKWIGRHALTALRDRQSANILNFGTRLTNNTTNGGSTEPTVPVTGFNNRPYLLVYLGDSILNGAPLKLNPIQISRLQDGFTAQTLVPIAPAGSTSQAVFGTQNNVFREILASANVSREVIKSEAYALQGYWLDDLVVTTVGWRRDEDFLIRPAIPVTATSPLRYGIDQFKLPNLPPRAATGEKKSMSAVVRWPQRLMKLPRGMTASAFINASENFTPSGTRVDWENNTLESPNGKTREIGFNVSALNDKVSVRFNTFETTVKNGSGSSSVLNTIQNNAINQLSGQIVAAANTGRIDYKPAIQRVLDAIPGFVKAYQVTLTGSALDGTLAYTSVPLSGLADTNDSVAKGEEFEIVFNPTRNWRLLANIAHQETVQSNIAPGTKRIMAALLPAWQHPDFANIPRSSETTLQYLTTLVLVPYANLIATEGLASAEQRKYRANLVTNYTFREGMFKGVGSGPAFAGRTRSASATSPRAIPIRR